MLLIETSTFTLTYPIIQSLEGTGHRLWIRHHFVEDDGVGLDQLNGKDQPRVHLVLVHRDTMVIAHQPFEQLLVNGFLIQDLRGQHIAE